jgi:predicted kinase
MANGTPLFTMLCGVPASGKSTFAARHLADHPETIIISSDARIEAIAAADGISYQEAYGLHAEAVKAQIRQDAADAFSVGKSVLWDQTNLTVAVRAQVLDLVPAHYVKVVHAFEVADDLLAARLTDREARQTRTIPAEVLAWQKASYARPTCDEGFDEVHIKSGNAA